MEAVGLPVSLVLGTVISNESAEAGPLPLLILSLVGGAVVILKGSEDGESLKALDCLFRGILAQFLGLRADPCTLQVHLCDFVALGLDRSMEFSILSDYHYTLRLSSSQFSVILSRNLLSWCLH